MPATRFATPILFSLLAVLMAATRVNHFAALPDASWAVFFIGGFYLAKQVRWAFPALMVLAVVIDYIVISRSGLNFWTHYCVSPGYWFLLPAHFAMWIGGDLLARLAERNAKLALAALVPTAIIAVAVCHLFAQGGFYWFSNSWYAEGTVGPTFAGWWKNYSDWLPSYLTSSAIYIGVAALIHIGAMLATGEARSTAHGDNKRRTN